MLRYPKEGSDPELMAVFYSQSCDRMYRASPAIRGEDPGPRVVMIDGFNRLVLATHLFVGFDRADIAEKIRETKEKSSDFVCAYIGSPANVRRIVSLRGTLVESELVESLVTIFCLPRSVAAYRQEAIAPDRDYEDYRSWLEPHL